MSKKSIQLSWLLRHGAKESGLLMDHSGFALVADVLRLTGLSEEAFLTIVAENNKSRFEIVGDKVRACQGHSLSGTVVTQEGLEATWRPCVLEQVYHGTTVEAAKSILKEGIDRMERTHVHLAEAVDAKTGKRSNVDILLEVSVDKLSAAGFPLFRAPNNVLLTRHVPPSAIIGVLPRTQRGLEAVNALLSLLSE